MSTIPSRSQLFSRVHEGTLIRTDVCAGVPVIPSCTYLQAGGSWESHRLLTLTRTCDLRGRPTAGRRFPGEPPGIHHPSTGSEVLVGRIRLRARAAGETLSDRLRRYAEEGVRRDEHPLVTFRDGPTGRRAGLVGGPDVWELAMWVADLSAEPDPVKALSAESGLPRHQIEAALRYQAAYPEEITARIELHRAESIAVPNG